MHLVLRDARDDDASQLIELIGACWSEYPGVIMDVDGEVPELRAIATAYQKRRGRFWIAEKAGRVIGSAGIAATKDPGVFELQKLYVAKDSRRQGLGARLCAVVESEARARGGKSLELWSDTRFTDAHRLYEKLGYIRGPQTRNLNDLSKTVEYYFRKDLE